ncbi:hypothetical protein PDJAM_G00154100 [Pangasius djambal]|uniref:Uncharacterized protein n=1 Tax=Pangasius djambal TaxID=1691987 RepID=A0ACC5ZJM9_9TELE|nr:hypothetical protein [Pangasius djambal]
MEEFSSGEEVGFSPDDASNAVKECIEGVIGGVDYSQNKVNQWTASVVEHSLTQLVKQGKAFKYIVNCAIMQKSGAGLHTANSCYWDTTTDGSCTVKWENRTMYCVVGFSPDDASNAVKECIEGVIGGVDYSQNKVNQWTASVVEHSLTQLVKQGKAFKYIVNCAIMQKSGAGLHTANSCYWDTTTDGSCTVKWENRTMYCVVSVFAVAL